MDEIGQFMLLKDQPQLIKKTLLAIVKKDLSKELKGEMVNIVYEAIWSLKKTFQKHLKLTWSHTYYP